MLVLCLRSDKPEAEIYLYDQDKKLSAVKWEAHRQLAETINLRIQKLLEKCNKTAADLDGILIYEGPGSFTGLRIGFSVANALGYAHNIPASASSTEDWIDKGLGSFKNISQFTPVHPIYGSEPNTTASKK